MKKTVIVKYIFRKFLAIFALPKRYFTENSRWVPLDSLATVLLFQNYVFGSTCEPHQLPSWICRLPHADVMNKKYETLVYTRAIRFVGKILKS